MHACAFQLYKYINMPNLILIFVHCGRHYLESHLPHSLVGNKLFSISSQRSLLQPYIKKKIHQGCLKFVLLAIYKKYK